MPPALALNKRFQAYNPSEFTAEMNLTRKCSESFANIYLGTH